MMLALDLYHVALYYEYCERGAITVEI